MSGVGLSFSLQITDIEPVLLGLLSAEKTIGMSVLLMVKSLKVGSKRAPCRWVLIRLACSPETIINNIKERMTS